MDNTQIGVIVVVTILVGVISVIVFLSVDWGGTAESNLNTIAEIVK